MKIDSVIYKKILPDTTIRANQVKPSSKIILTQIKSKKVPNASSSQ